MEEIIKHWKDNGSKHIETEKQFRELLSSLSPSKSDQEKEIEGLKATIDRMAGRMLEIDREYQSRIKELESKSYWVSVQPDEKHIESVTAEKLKHDPYWVNPRNRKLKMIVEMFMREMYHFGWNNRTDLPSPPNSEIRKEGDNG